MNDVKPLDMAKSPDLPGSWFALQRAAQRARELAAQTGTALVVERNGVLEHIYPRVPAANPNAAQEASRPYGKPE